MKRILCIILAVSFALALAVSAGLFLIGEPADGNQLVVLTEEEGNELTIHVTTPASAIAFWGWNSTQKGNALYIRGRKVLVSSLFSSGSYSTTVDISELSEVYLGGRQIWTK